MSNNTDKHQQGKLSNNYNISWIRENFNNFKTIQELVSVIGANQLNFTTVYKPFFPYSSMNR